MLQRSLHLLEIMEPSDTNNETKTNSQTTEQDEAGQLDVWQLQKEVGMHLLERAEYFIVESLISQAVSVGLKAQVWRPHHLHEEAIREVK